MILYSWLTAKKLIIIAVITFIAIAGLFWQAGVGLGLECQTLWWYDNDHQYCQQDEFCELDMYEGFHVFGTKEKCEAGQQLCSDGTFYGGCSADKPNYCDNGSLIDKCSVCGCANGKTCQSNGSCGQPPTAFIDTITPSSIAAGQLVSFEGRGTDTDGSVIGYSWRSSIDGQLSTESSFETSTLSVGSHTVYFKVQDNDGAWSDEVSASLSATQGQPPVLDSIGDKTVSEGGTLTFTVSATDPDEGTILTYSIGNFPQDKGATFDAGTRVFSWTPAAGQVGIYSDIHFEVSDGILTDSEDITITVIESTGVQNQAPELAPIGDKTISHGELLIFTISAADPDGDTLTYSASNLPQGAVFDAATQVFNWTPIIEQVGAYSLLHFEVSDGILTDSEDIAITVTEEETENGIPLPSETILLKTREDSRVYEIKDNKKHWIPNSEVFSSSGFKWTDIQEVQRDELEQYSRVKLLQAQGDYKVYYLAQSGLIRHIPTSEIFISYGNKWEDIFTVSQTELTAYPANNLIHLEGGYKIYKLEFGIKRWIKTAEAFNRLGFDWNKIAPVNATEFNYYAIGDPIR